MFKHSDAEKLYQDWLVAKERVKKNNKGFARIALHNTELSLRDYVQKYKLQNSAYDPDNS